MKEPRDKIGNLFGRKAIAAILRHHRQKAMLRYLQYLKSDSRPITEEERLTYQPPLKKWWLGKPRGRSPE